MSVLPVNQVQRMKPAMMPVEKILRVMLRSAPKMNMCLKINVSLARQGLIMILGMIQVGTILYVMLSFA